ncbi:MAG: tRNA dihydrouridine synthase DusB [Rhizobiales bacterium]|nr:tRNA dihydrouridine synthase DusB [Hyphomicrobiales bacterium]MBA69101.1 tRNA dihydrouridine synthase DusB [Hyphomicrobiales bacterium]|tara:strand:+ start:2821 stop:3813 length:993 start_codon:yes stop_codon:yes gene_type:complete
MDEPLLIDPVATRNRIFLAPMSGVTDLPFRRIAQRCGAGMVVTEMVASRELVANRQESWTRLKAADFRPHVVQLAGREPEWMAEAAKISEAQGADIIDINMGCPAKKVTGGYSGSALMREPERALAIIEATVKAVSVPVSLKMRLGWDEKSLNAGELARAAVSAGIRMITVHGRTRCQFYEGVADWEAIARVRDQVDVPFVANGDIACREDAEACMKITGAVAVMVGRAAQGRPWLCGEIAGDPAAPNRDEQMKIARDHYGMMIEHYGERAGVRHARKHLGWYLDHLAPRTPAALRREIMTGQEVVTVAGLFAEALESADENRGMMERAA